MADLTDRDTMKIVIKYLHFSDTSSNYKNVAKKFLSSYREDEKSYTPLESLVLMFQALLK